MTFWKATLQWRATKRCSRKRLFSCRNRTACCIYGTSFTGPSVTHLLCWHQFMSFSCSCWDITRGRKMKSIVLVALIAIILGCKNDPRAAQPKAPAPEDSIPTVIPAHLAHKGNLNPPAFHPELQQANITGRHAPAEGGVHG